MPTSHRARGRVNGWRRLAATAGALVLLQSCAVGPHYVAPDPASIVPGAYPAASGDAATAGAPSDRWWEAFDDPLLDHLVGASLVANPDLLAAESRVAQARSLAEAAGAHYYPEVNLDGRVGEDRISLNGENLALIPFTPSRTQFVDYRVGFDASWEIDLFGHTRRQVEAAHAREGSAAESRNDARTVLAAEVVRAYLNFWIAADRLAVAGQNEAAYADTARLVSLQRDAGWASDLEWNRAEADRIASTAVSPGLYADREAALYRLSSLTTVPVEELDRELAADRTPRAIAGPVPAGLPADLLRRRPDVRRAERDLAAATGDAGAAVADRFPRISLVGNLGLDSVHPGNLFDSASRYWNVGPQVSIPVFSAGRLKAQAAAAEAARQVALQSYRSTVLAALADAETALIRYAMDLHRHETIEAALARLKGTLELTRLRYQAGEATLLEVRDAERAVCGLSDEAAVLGGQVALDYVALQKALGGGWQAGAASTVSAR